MHQHKPVTSVPLTFQINSLLISHIDAICVTTFILDLINVKTLTLNANFLARISHYGSLPFPSSAYSYHFDIHRCAANDDGRWSSSKLKRRSYIGLSHKTVSTRTYGPLRPISQFEISPFLFQPYSPTIYICWYLSLP
jgi:hypothetical protein